MTNQLQQNNPLNRLSVKTKMIIAGTISIIAIAGIIYSKVPSSAELAILKTYRTEAFAKAVWNDANQKYLSAIQTMDQAKAQAEQARQNRAMIESNQLFIQPQQ